MKKILLFALSILFFWQSGNAQVALNPYFWDQGLSYNPAGVGALVDESVQMSIASSNGLDSDRSNTFRGQITSINRSPIIEPSIADTKNLYYISYQKTHTFKDKKRLTAGLQYQKSENANQLLYDPSSFGITTNIHLPRFKANVKEEYLSFGLQMNLLFRKPNGKSIDLLYIELTDLLISSDNIDPVKFEDQFKDTGTQNTIGINYREHRYGKSIFNLGLNFINMQHKVTGSTLTSSASYSFNNANLNSLRAVIEYQFIANQKLQLDFNINSRARFFRSSFLPSSILNISEISLGVGAGFKLGYENILRLAFIYGRDSKAGALTTLGTSLEHNQYSFNLSFTRYTWPRVASIFQLGVIYKLNHQGLPTLLRVNN